MTKLIKTQKSLTKHLNTKINQINRIYGEWVWNEDKTKTTTLMKKYLPNTTIEWDYLQTYLENETNYLNGLVSEVNRGYLNESYQYLINYNNLQNHHLI